LNIYHIYIITNFFKIITEYKNIEKLHVIYIKLFV